ncbi:helix-turn-helix domain-containing protein [Paenibacillus glucanolyticus]|nr:MULTISPECIES: AraC family transcriptional regulator [Paenibacillus]AWP30816.1 AraC family transcriptional regulator [Paenibacillus sp. Cedars]
MTPLRKPFKGDPLFPMELVYRTTKSPEVELPHHLHDLYELVYVYQGKGTFFIENKLMEKKAGDLFIIPGNTIHSSFPDPDDPIISSALFFAPSLVLGANGSDLQYAILSCFDVAQKSGSYRHELPKSNQQYIEGMLKRISEETRLAQLGFREALVLLLRSLLLHINRYISTLSAEQPAHSQIGPSWLRNSIQWIHEHLDQPIGLATLSAHASVDPAHFSRMFKKYTGLHVTGYINAKRIARAKELLLHHEKSIGQIAEICGYDTLTHFHRNFKTLTGMTPGAYRKQVIDS